MNCSVGFRYGQMWVVYRPRRRVSWLMRCWLLFRMAYNGPFYQQYCWHRYEPFLAPKNGAHLLMMGWLVSLLRLHCTTRPGTSASWARGYQDSGASAWANTVGADKTWLRTWFHFLNESFDWESAMEAELIFPPQREYQTSEETMTAWVAVSLAWFLSPDLNIELRQDAKPLFILDWCWNQIILKGRGIYMSPIEGALHIYIPVMRLPIVFLIGFSFLILFQTILTPMTYTLTPPFSNQT